MASKKTKWSMDEKIRIVLQAFNPETKAAELCREHNWLPEPRIPGRRNFWKAARSL